MDEDILKLFNESIKLELKVSQMYGIFRDTFPRDTLFWRRLAMEEENHASLLRSGRDRFGPLGKFPMEMLSSSTDELVATNDKIEKMIKEFETNPPTRAEAFNSALELEQYAGELHFLQFMEKESGSEIDKIFKRLNLSDRNHAVMIREYMDTHGINLR